MTDYEITYKIKTILNNKDCNAMREVITNYPDFSYGMTLIDCTIIYAMVKLKWYDEVKLILKDHNKIFIMISDIPINNIMQIFKMSDIDNGIIEDLILTIKQYSISEKRKLISCLYDYDDIMFKKYISYDPLLKT